MKAISFYKNTVINTYTYFKKSIFILAPLFIILSILFAFPIYAKAASCEQITFDESSPTEAKSFLITASGMQVDKNIENIWFKVSFENEMVRFYKPEKSKNGDYTLNFDAKDFNNQYGIYYVTVYAQYPPIEGGLELLKSRGIEIVEEVTSTYIMGKSQTTPDQMVKYFEDSLFEYPQFYEQEPRGVSLEEFAQMYYDICQNEGVRAEAAWVQMCLETGYLNFGNLVKKEQFNFAGLGSTGPGSPGFDFAKEYGDDYDGIRAGIIAHVQHLKCYASDEGVNMLFEGEAYDPRWAEYLREISATLERLEGNWAVSAGYGMDLARGVEKLLNTK